MDKKGRVSGQLTKDDLDHLIGQIRHIKKHLPFLIQLSPEERRGGLKMGDRTVAFVERALQIAQERKDLLPPYVDLEEMERDLELWKNLGILARELSSLLEAIEDTRMAAGADAYTTALFIYNSLRQAAEAGVPGLDTLIAELSRRFEYATKGRTSDEEQSGENQQE